MQMAEEFLCLKGNLENQRAKCCHIKGNEFTTKSERYQIADMRLHPRPARRDFG